MTVLFKTGSAQERFRWAMQIVHIPPEGLTIEKFLTQAGVYAGIDSRIIVAVLAEFRRKKGLHVRVFDE